MPQKERSATKKQLSSFDICALVAELQSIIGARIEKVFHYQASPMELQLRISTAEEKKELQINVGSWLYLTNTEPKRPPESTEKLTLFAQTLRRHLIGARISKIEQHGFDRIIEFSAETIAGRKYVIHFEVFGSGNVVMVKDGTIVAVLSTMTMRDRTLRAGLVYIYPPSRINIKEISEMEFTGAVKKSGSDIVRTLALELNLGGSYAEELCIRAGLDKSRKAAELSDSECNRLYAALLYLLEKCRSGGYGEVVLDGQSEVFDIQPWALRIYEKHQKIRTASFNECIARFAEMASSGLGGDEKIRSEIEKLKRKLEQQRSAIPEIEAQAELNRKIGDTLYSIGEKVERAILLLRRAKEKKSIEATVKLLKEQKAVIAVDIAKWTFRTCVCIDGTDVPVAIEIASNFHENVASYYEKAKSQKEKLDGAKAAFSATLKEIESLSKKVILRDSASTGKMPVVKSYWFEQYRWFISSDGNIVVAGRDAQSNDRVVKKYLRDGDRYAHAEIHGAPSVVVKNKGEGTISEATLREACEFALSFSKAWGMKLSHGSAYWVMPEQVSKTPNTGEAVPRGGFIIRGKKNFVESDILCAVGEIKYERDRKIMCGPVSAVVAKTERYIILQPGEVTKNEMAKELARNLGTSVDLMQALLPSGDTKIAEKVGMEKLYS